MSILYLARTDGSDMRVRKEIISLSKKFDYAQIYAVLLPSRDNYPLGKELKNVVYYEVGRFLSKYKIVKPLLPLLFAMKAVAILATKKVKSVHVVDDEMVLTIFICRLLNIHVVLDVFDSYELKFSEKKGFIGAFLRWISKVAKHSANKIVVTDLWRKNLLDQVFFEKTFILPNYPSTESLPELSDLKQLNDKYDNSLFFGGSLFKSRGIDTLLEFLDKNPDKKIQCAGWILDEAAEHFIKHSQVVYHGILSQNLANELCSQCLASIALYEPKNMNNIYASPNKIYDSLCMGEFIFINKETKLASWIGRSNLVISFDYHDSDGLLNACKQVAIIKGNRSTKRYATAYRRLFIWEKFEGVLFGLHEEPLNNL